MRDMIYGEHIQRGPLKMQGESAAYINHFWEQHRKKGGMTYKIIIYVDYHCMEELIFA